jgi:hypothetical protein
MRFFNLFSLEMSHKMTKSRRIRCAGHEVCMGEMENAYIILVGRPEGKSPP